MVCDQYISQMHALLMSRRCHSCEGWPGSFQFRKEQYGPGQALQPSLHGRSGMSHDLHLSDLMTDLQLDAEP